MTSLHHTLTLPLISSRETRFDSATSLKYRQMNPSTHILDTHDSRQHKPRNSSCASLMSSSERKEFKKQRILLNLVEKKIKEGTYDEN